MELLFLLFFAVAPNLLVSGLTYAVTRNRRTSFRASRILSLALTGFPILVAVLAVLQNTDSDPDAGFPAFIAAVAMAPITVASWGTTFLLRPRQEKADLPGMGFSSENC